MQTVARQLLRQHDRFYSYSSLRNVPAVRTAGGLAGVTTDNVVNHWMLPEISFECINRGIQTTIAPVIADAGLNIARTATDDLGWELTRGITARSPCAFVIGTHAFYGKATFAIATVAGTDDCLFGFRKAEAYQAAVDDYADMAALNVISGAINIETIKGGAATTTTDTTDTWVDAASKTLEVYVSSAGVVTYKITGAAPTVTAAYTFTSALTVVPFLYYLNSATTNATLTLTAWEVGLQ